MRSERETHLTFAAQIPVKSAHSINTPATGAVWDFGDLVRGGVPNPGEKTGKKRLEFHVSDVHPFRRAVAIRDTTELILLESKVLAQHP
jgi:hypothetical protein